MTKKRIKVGLVGCGQIADAHLQQIRRIPWADPVAVCDLEPLLARQALHAALLEFDHPIDGDRRSFTAPLWPDMKELISLLRKHRHRRVANVRGCRVEFEPTDDLEA